MEESIEERKEEIKVDESVEERKKEVRVKIDNLLKNKYQWMLIGLVVFATLFRLYYFFMVKDQPIWWDEGDYLAIAKGLMYGWQNQEWWIHFSGIRPLLMPIIWYFLFLIKSPEIVIRFITLLIPSIVSVYLVYAIGRDLYNKNVGLISGLMLSVYWVHMFYTFRLLTDIPAMFFGLLSLYFFWSRYITKNENKGLYYAILFGILGFSVRFPLAIVPVSYPIYLFTVKRLKLLKDKVFWKSMGFGVLVLGLYLIMAEFLGSGIRVAFRMYFGSEAASLKTPIISSFKGIITQIPMLMESVWFLMLIIGLITLINLVLGFDLFLKQKKEKLNSDFFILLWIVMTLFFYIVIIRAANDRWLLMLMPPLFFISSNGILFVYDKVKKYNKEIAILIIVVILLGGVYQHVKHANMLIIQKKDTYKEEKLAGLWIKEDFKEKNPKIITASVVQIAYYSEGYTYSFYKDPPKECFDIYGVLIKTEECYKKTEEQFNEKVKEINPDYLIVHVFEPVFTPQWAYSYPERHNLSIVQGYFFDEAKTQPALIIYKF